MAWPTFTVDVTQDGNQIKVYGAVPASELPAGFEVIIDGISNLEVSYGTAVMYDGSNNPYSHLYLVRPYTGVTATNLEMVVKPTGSQFNDVVGIFQNASNLLNSTMEGFRQFVEGTSPVTFQPLDENAEPISIKPLLQMNQEAQTAVSEAISAFQNAAGTAAGYDVTSSQTDVGNGNNEQPKLLKVGDGGVLKAINGATLNLDTVTTRGERTAYNFSGFTKGNWEQISVILNDAQFQGKDQIKQILHVIDGSGGMWERQSNDGGVTWHSEKEYIHTGNTGITPSTNGNLGIGTSMPESKFHLKDSDDLYQQFTKDGVGASRIGQTGASLTLGSDLGNGSTERMRINAVGNVLIGKKIDNGIDKLQVSGSISATEGTNRGEFIFDNRDGNSYRNLTDISDGGAYVVTYNEGATLITGVNGGHQREWDFPINCDVGSYVVEIHGFTKDGNISGNSNDLTVTPAISTYINNSSKMLFSVATPVGAQVCFKKRSAPFAITTGQAQIGLHIGGYSGARAFAITAIKLIRIN